MGSFWEEVVPTRKEEDNSSQIGVEIENWGVWGSEWACCILEGFRHLENGFIVRYKFKMGILAAG